MRIQILSDLHFEMRPDWRKFVRGLDAPGVDVLVLAGDVCYARQAVEVYRAFSEKYPWVVIIAGNHEFWHTKNPSPDVTLAVLREAADLTNVRFLDNSEVTLDGQRFLGSTLWFPATPFAKQHRNQFSDFNVIPGFDKWVWDANKRAVAYVRHARKGDVVVVHHLPSYKSVHPMYEHEPSNVYFVCPIDEIIERKQPALVIHGHSHKSSDYHIGKTRVVCNPLGYPSEARSFVKMVVEVQDGSCI